MSSSKYNGLLGMSEMETAMRVLEDKANELNTTIDTLRIRAAWFVDDKDSHKLIGFSQMCCRGWIIPDYPNSEFIPSRELIDRLNGRWGTSYTYPKTKVELLEEMFKAREQEA